MTAAVLALLASLSWGTSDFLAGLEARRFGWLNPAVTMAWAAVELHERLRPVQLFAAALVFSGIVCLAAG